MTKHIVEHVYDMLIRGIPQSKIARYLQKDKGYISRITNALVDAGFIICTNPRDRVKFYEATRKPLLEEDAKLLSTFQREKKRKNEHRVCFIRCHAIRFQAVIKACRKRVPWDRSWRTRGVDHFFYQFPFENIGVVGFHRLRSRSSDVLLISLPSFRWDRRRGSPEPVMREIASSCGSWFMRRFNADLRDLKRCKGGHFAIPVRDPDLVKIAQRSTVRLGDYMMDSSPPSNTPEFESEGFGALERLLSLPDKVSQIERRMDRIEDSVIRLVDNVEKINNAVIRLTDVFNVPSKPDELRDVT